MKNKISLVKLAQMYTAVSSYVLKVKGLHERDCFIRQSGRYEDL